MAKNVYFYLLLIECLKNIAGIEKTLYLLIESLDFGLYYLVNAAGTPPSTVNIQPVVFSDFEEAKNAIDSAISDG